jgi:putative membrane protein
MHLGSEEAGEVERRVAALEARTGVQVVAAVVERSDHYPEIPWAAFALGVSAAALATAVAAGLRPGWEGGAGGLLQAVAILAAGGATALAAAASPGLARLFLRRPRAEGEVLQRAESLFLEREVFRAPGRTGVLILASRFERRVVVVPDAGFRGRVAPEEWGAVVEAMRPALAAGRAGAAFLAGLDALEALLARRGFAPGAGAGPGLPDRPVEAP